MARSLPPQSIRLSEPQRGRSGAPRGFALFALGFRPFYLLAALFSAVAMLGWMAVLEGHGWAGAIAPLAWHQHEMVFGFALAVIVGFLLTAGRAWTGLPTPQGWRLGLLAALWLAARILVFTGPVSVAALADIAFPFVLAAVIGQVLLKARSRRNYFAIAVLAAFGIANIGFYLEQAGVAAMPPGTSVQAALYLVVFMVVMIGGRVVPAFTANALPGAGVVVRSPRLDWTALLFTLGAFVTAAANAPAWLVAPLAAIASLLHFARQARWAPLATLRRPILWILHLSHAWIPLGLALLALAALGWVPRAVPLHAFGAGAVGGMIIGMITRTALGHTARPLRAGWPEVTAYALVHLAAAARVLAGLLPEAYSILVSTAAHLWALAFLVYFAAYLPRLIRPRPDGKPG
jgi:uncharacterized protein involved in response to NO